MSTYRQNQTAYINCDNQYTSKGEFQFQQITVIHCIRKSLFYNTLFVSVPPFSRSLRAATRWEPSGLLPVDKNLYWSCNRHMGA